MQQILPLNNMSATKEKVSIRSKAIRKFSQNLPNPVTSLQSTIQQQFLIGDETFTVLAQKAKGAEGMTWRISSN